MTVHTLNLVSKYLGGYTNADPVERGFTFSIDKPIKVKALRIFTNVQINTAYRVTIDGKAYNFAAPLGNYLATGYLLNFSPEVELGVGSHKIGIDSGGNNSFEIVRSANATGQTISVGGVNFSNVQNSTDYVGLVPYLEVSFTANNSPTIKLTSPPENLLGTDGNCEDLTKWYEPLGNTLSLDPTSKVYGNNSIRCTAKNDNYPCIVRKDIAYLLHTGRYYLVLADAKKSVNKTLHLNVEANSVPLYNVFSGNFAVGPNFSTRYVKFDGTEACRGSVAYIDFETSQEWMSGDYFNFDGVRLYEISKAVYDKIDVDPEYTGDKLVAKFPYTDPTINQSLVEGNTYVIEGSASDADNGNVVTVKYSIDDGTEYNITAAVSDGTTAIPFSKTLTYLNSRLYDGQTAVTPILDDQVPHTLKVWAADDQPASSTPATRTFNVMYNQPPQISGTDQNLGSILVSPSINYTVTDIEHYTFTVTEKVDDTVIRTFNGVDGQTETLTIPADIWVTLQPDVTHSLTITATDQYGASSTRTYTFIRTVDGIELVTKNSLPADAQPARMVLTLNGTYPSNGLLVEVCNNGNDASPAWEDATSAVLNGRPYVFTNTTKTAADWGIKIRIKMLPGA